MCGVFGFVSKHGKPVNLNVLKRVAVATQQRGPHAWGMAWIDGRGRLHMFKQTGKVADAVALLAMASDARLLIGHCRYATHGSPDNNLNNHPHPSDGGWIVHNGVISDHEDLAIENELYPVTSCDSEVLGLLIENGDGKLLNRVARAVSKARSRPLVMLGLWKPGHLIFARKGNPLHRGDASEGTYLASLPEGLPGKAKEIADNQVFGYHLEDFANVL